MLGDKSGLLYLTGQNLTGTGMYLASIKRPWLLGSPDRKDKVETYHSTVQFSPENTFQSLSGRDQILSAGASCAL